MPFVKIKRINRFLQKKDVYNRRFFEDFITYLGYEMKKRACFIQMHYTDITNNLKRFNPLKKIKNSQLFDEIVIAAADIEENKVLKDWAALWQVKIRFGDKENVLERFLEIAEELSVSTVLRIIPSWYFLDLNYVKTLIFELESRSADYINVPRDYDFRFSGDVFSVSFLEKLNSFFSSSQKEHNYAKFNPWGFVDTQCDLNICKIFNINQTPVYSHEKFIKFKRVYNRVWPEHWGKADRPQMSYSIVKQYISVSTSRVLDIACGYGAGTKEILDSGAYEVVGADVSQKLISYCKNKFKDEKKLSFIKLDGEQFDFSENPFDVIVSIHTMEHIPNEKLFLNNIRKSLTKNGIFILEVPLLMKYPFASSEEPYGDGHIREYYPMALVSLFSKYFKLLDTYGMSRGFYVELEKARNAALLIGSNSK